MGHKQVFVVILFLSSAVPVQSSTPVGQWVGSFDVDGSRVLLFGNIDRQGNEF